MKSHGVQQQLIKHNLTYNQGVRAGLQEHKVTRCVELGVLLMRARFHLHSMSCTPSRPPLPDSQRLPLALQEGHGVISRRRALLPLHLDLRLRRELQLDGAGVHLGGAQQLLHALHLLTLKDHHGPGGAGRGLLLGHGGGDGVRAGGLWRPIHVSAAWTVGGGAAPRASFSQLLGLSRCGRRRGRGGGSGMGRGALVIQLGFSPGTPPAALPGILAGVVVVFLALGLFGYDGDLLTHL